MSFNHAQTENETLSDDQKQKLFIKLDMDKQSQLETACYKIKGVGDKRESFVTAPTEPVPFML